MNEQMTEQGVRGQKIWNTEIIKIMFSDDKLA